MMQIEPRILEVINPLSLSHSLLKLLAAIFVALKSFASTLLAMLRVRRWQVAAGTVYSAVNFIEGEKM